MGFFAILAATTLAELIACHTKLEALTVVFAAAGLLAGAALTMLGGDQFLFKCLWVPLNYFRASLMPCLFTLNNILAVRASTVHATNPAVCEAFTIKLQALRPRAMAPFNYSV